jgi:hypothetical protein
VVEIRQQLLLVILGTDACLHNSLPAVHKRLRVPANLLHLLTLLLLLLVLLQMM